LRQVFRLLLGMICISAVMLTTVSATAAEGSFSMKFDMGTADSPLKEGFLRLTPDTTYSAERGYGWDKEPAGAKDSTEHVFELWGKKTPAVDYVLGVDDMTVDCVNDPESLQFSVDIANGTYDVAIWVGDLTTPLTHISVLANGRPLKEDFDSRTLWRMNMDTDRGAHRLVRSTVEVSSGKLTVAVTGDKNAQAEYVEKPTGSAGKLVEKVARMAFTEVAIQGLVVRSHVYLPLQLSEGMLVLTRMDTPQEARGFVGRFNGGEYAKALKLARSIDGERWPVLKAAALLWLAGRPEVEEERELLPEAIGILEARVADDPEGMAAEDLLWDARLLSESVKAFYGYGYAYTGLGVRQQMGRAEALLIQLDDPSRPLYWKAKLYLARLTCVMDPLRWAWWYERGQEMFREMEKDFPDNKWVRLYLDDEWRWPEGQISEPRVYKGWDIPEYRDGTEGAPAWAIYMREQYARMIDLSEWWIDNRQLENGEVGGGWGDDVELVPLWAFVGLISDGANDKLMEGTRRLVDGVWNSDEVNGDQGFATVFTWVKPASELVAYSQPMMVAIDYGNPRYVERVMRTTKFLRDFATGINEKGHRHFKSAYLNATRLGEEEWVKIDAPLCFRPGFGAAALCWYSEHAEAVNFMTEWLDSWYVVSQSTDKGKPRGIFPAAVAFETGELGGPGKENWYDGSHEGPQGLPSDSFSWPAYQNYLYDLFTAWFLRTRDEKYLEPMAALVEIARHYGPGRQDPLPEGTYPWFEQTVHPRFVNTGARFQLRSVLNVKLMTGTEKYDEYLKAKLGGYAKFLLEGDVTEMADGMEKAGRELRTRWPFVTTEVALTDRMVVPGSHELLLAYTGGNLESLHHGLPFHAVTYEDTTKNFAALVRAQSEKDLKLWIYSFLPEDREVGIRPWRLQVGGKYELKVGPDTDENWEIDEAGTTKEFVLEHRGDSVRFNLPSRQLQVVEVRQTKAPVVQAKYSPDLGISDEDVFWLSDQEVAARVHNIGSKSASNIRVELSVVEEDERQKVGEAVISYLDSPLTLDPQTKLVSFLVKEELRGGPLVVTIDPDDEIYEITERNNVLELAAEASD